MVDLPASLTSQVRDGRVVLLLGAGASLAARARHGDSPPDGERLANIPGYIPPERFIKALEYVHQRRYAKAEVDESDDRRVQEQP